MPYDLILVILIILLPSIANIVVHHNYKKYSKENSNRSLTGSEVARMILDKNGLNNINILKGSGQLTDYFDAKNQVIVLSPEVYSKSSISSIAVAAHEVGHAVQHKENYAPLKLRTTLVPLVNFSSKLSTVFLFLGIVLGFLNLFDIGILLLLVGLLFHLVTLPVEFNASKRAKQELESINIVTNNNEQIGVKKMLNAAAFTYIAGFLAMALQILRLIAIRNND